MKKEINRQKRVVVSLRKKGYIIDDLQGKTEDEIKNLPLPRKLKEDIWAMIESGSMWRYLDNVPAESDIQLNNIIAGIVGSNDRVTAPITSTKDIKLMNEAIKGNSDVSLSKTDLQNFVNNYSLVSIPSFMRILRPLLDGLEYDQDVLREVVNERIAVNKLKKQDKSKK